MTDEIKKNIQSQLRDNSISSEILTFIQHKYNHDSNNSIFETQDISNYITKMRAQRLDNMISIQTLNVTLHNDFDWFVKIQLNSMTTKVEYLFFCNKASKKMLLHNEKTLILNCIYKTNRYHMSLIIETEVTDLNTFFFVDMCFLKSEKLDDYCFLIKTYKKLYQELNIPLSEVWLSDEEFNISTAIAQEICSSAVHLLCCWHLKQNVFINCHKHFRDRTDSKKLWIQFFDNKHDSPVVQSHFQHLLYASSEKKLDEIWKNIQRIYEPINDNISRYIAQEILSKKIKWCRVWIDGYLHFNNHIISRSKGQHAALKATLRSSQDDIDIVVRKAAEICDRQRSAYVLALSQTKANYPKRLNKGIFRNLRALITSFALTQILHQYEKLMKTRNKNTNLSICIKHFKNTMSLSCAHIIEERMTDADREKILLLIDVHSHWRFQKSKRHYVESAIFIDIEVEVEVKTKMEKTPTHDPLLNIQNSQKMRSKNRLKFAFNRSKTAAKQNRLEKRQRAFENFTQRMFSNFEHAQTIDLTIDEIVQVPSSQLFSSSYTIMSLSSSQLYSQAMQYDEKFTDFTTITVNSVRITTGRKRKININANINKRAKTG